MNNEIDRWQARVYLYFTITSSIWRNVSVTLFMGSPFTVLRDFFIRLHDIIQFRVVYSIIVWPVSFALVTF